MFFNNPSDILINITNSDVVTPSKNAFGAHVGALLEKQKVKLAQFRGTPVVVIRQPVQPEASDEFHARHCNNFITQSVNCITLNSQQTYSTAWRAYTHWCSLAQVNPLLDGPPKPFQVTTFAHDHRIMALGAFMSYLAVDKQLHPDTISTYMAGVRDGFRLQGRELEIFNHVSLKQLKQSIRLDWRSFEANTKNYSKLLPITVEMLVVMRTNVANFSLATDHAAYVACLMATTMLLRRSELIVTIADHFIRAKDVTFHLIDSDGTPFDCFAHEASQYPISQLVGVTTYLRSAKADLWGDGYKVSYPVTPLTSDCAYCVATEMFTWARIARPEPDSPFLSHQKGLGNTFGLSYDHYRKMIHRTAQACGFDPSRFSTHSCRIGGATILAAAGHPNHYIAKAGRWKSTAFLDYIRYAAESMKSILTSLVNPKVYTNRDMLRLNPGAVFLKIRV